VNKKPNITFTALLVLPVIVFLLSQIVFSGYSGSFSHWLLFYFTDTIFVPLYLIAVFNYCVWRQKHNVKLVIIGCIISALATVVIDFYKYTRFSIDIIHRSFTLEFLIMYTFITLFVLLSGIVLSLVIKRLISMKERLATLFSILLVLPIIIFFTLHIWDINILLSIFYNAIYPTVLGIMYVTITIPLYLVTIFNFFTLWRKQNIKLGILGSYFSFLTTISLIFYEYSGEFFSEELLPLIGYILISMFIFFLGIGLSIRIKQLKANQQQSN